MRIKTGAIAALLMLGSMLVTTNPAGAGGNAVASDDEQHCAVRVVGQKSSGELIVSPMVCRSTQADAVQGVGAMSTTGFSTQATFTIGTHYDGFGATGSSFSVVGDNCNGGWLNLSSTWDNRVSSTVNGCPQVRHYDGSNVTGSSETTYGAGGSLSVMNNRANSIKYSS